jgi:hypothetical protein
MLMTAAHQVQEADMFPADQLRLQWDLKLSSGILMLLQRHTVVAALRLFFYLSFSTRIVLFGTCGRGRGRLASIFR